MSTSENQKKVFFHKPQEVEYPLSLGTTERVSVESDRAQANGLSWHPSISSDGCYVAFQSNTTNSVIGDTKGISLCTNGNRVRNRRLRG